MAGETLGEAFDRLDLRPIPANDVLERMGDEERDRAIRASFVTDLSDLPEWYRGKVEAWAAEAVAQAEARDASRQAS